MQEVEQMELGFGERIQKLQEELANVRERQVKKEKA